MSFHTASLETSALVIGAITMAAGGFLLALLLLCAFSWVAGLVGARLFRRVRRVYHLTVIAYWLDRLEQGGLRVFQKAEQDDLDRKAAAHAPCFYPPPPSPPNPSKSGGDRVKGRS